MTDQKYYSLNDVFTFGKHKGKTVDEVLSIDSSYISWVHHKTSYFLMGDDVIDKYTGTTRNKMMIDPVSGRSMTVRDVLVSWNMKKISVEEENHASRERQMEAKDRYEEERRNLDEMKRDAYSDGDGTELWSLKNE